MCLKDFLALGLSRLWMQEVIEGIGFFSLDAVFLLLCIDDIVSFCLRVNERFLC